MLRVIKAAETTDPNDKADWKTLVADALALDKVMAQLSSGWSTGLAGFTMFCTAIFSGFFCQFVNKPYYDAIAAQPAGSSTQNTMPKGLLIFNMIVFSSIPLLISNDVAYTSSKCDNLMNTLNDLGIKHGEKHHVRIDLLETRLRWLHNSQGLGFVIFGMVLDRRSLGKLAAAIGGGLINVITWVLAMSDEANAVAAGGNSTCAFNAQQLAGLQAAMVGRNETCGYNSTLDEILAM